MKKKVSLTAFGITLTLVASVGIGAFVLANANVRSYRAASPTGSHASAGPLSSWPTVQPAGGRTSPRSSVGAGVQPSEFPSPTIGPASLPDTASPSEPALHAMPSGGVHRTLRLTSQDGGKTFHVAVGTTFQLMYEYDGKVWNNSFDRSVIAYVGPAAWLMAVGSGQTILHSGGSPYCGDSCPTQDISTTIIVD